ncbi:hypothetical protein L1F28_08140 [Arthrospira platensis NCB002]|uniref:Transposase n=1 Tax=Limnospira platensis NIES-46 TaxID=1236695 RepID=A0A5M3T4N8_LIMPL|nr:hypothetical protein [Arthrospira platensis NCB002]BDT16423.1 hypothetical protein N39L_61460 [Arthrospira platensis NIES-39]GCE92850.1 hypothetical protein NIES46_08930 [Arthrospira platensis NIES-46]
MSGFILIKCVTGFFITNHFQYFYGLLRFYPHYESPEFPTQYGMRRNHKLVATFLQKVTITQHYQIFPRRVFGICSITTKKPIFFP